MDDYLVISTGADLVCADVLRLVFSNSLAMDVTVDKPVEENIRFLDLSLNVGSSPLCRMYSCRTRKRVLPFNSSHSKLVKKEIAFLGWEALTSWRGLWNAN